MLRSCTSIIDNLILSSQVILVLYAPLDIHQYCRYSRGLIDFAELEIANGLVEVYQEMIVLREYEVAQNFGNALMSLLILEAGNIDVYDIRYSGGDPTDPLQDALATYLNQAAVKSKMNAGSQSWTACASTPYFELLDDISRSSEFLFPTLLANYRVLLYANPTASFFF
jgi:sensor histidine kinase YesM